MASSPTGVRWRPPALAAGRRQRRKASVTEPSASPGWNRCGNSTAGTVPGRRQGPTSAVRRARGDGSAGSGRRTGWWLRHPWERRMRRRFPIKRLIGLGCRACRGGPSAADTDRAPQGRAKRAADPGGGDRADRRPRRQGHDHAPARRGRGLNIATLYHYFGSKSDLLGAIVDERHYDAGLRHLTLPVDPTLAPRPRLERFFAQLARRRWASCGCGACSSARACATTPWRSPRPGDCPAPLEAGRRPLAGRAVPRAGHDDPATPDRDGGHLGRHRPAPRRVPRGDAARRRRPRSPASPGGPPPPPRVVFPAGHDRPRP